MTVPTCFRIFAVTISLHSWLASAELPDTGFSYQGFLNEETHPANGSYDMTFTLFGTNLDGIALAGPATNSAIHVENGVFTTLINFGDAFASGADWLEISVRTNGGGSFVALAPRQRLTAAPRSVFAATAGQLAGKLDATNISGTIPQAQLPPVVITNGAAAVSLAGSFFGSGANLTNIPSASLTGTISPQQLSGFGNYEYAFYPITNTPNFGDGYYYCQAGGRTYLHRQVSYWTPSVTSATNVAFFGGGNWNLADSSGYAVVTNLANNNLGQYVEWDEASTNISFTLKGSSQFWQLLVDGVPEASQHYGEITANIGMPYLYSYSFPDRRMRHLEIYGNFGFYGLAAQINDGSGYGPPRRRSKRCVIFGDSFSGSPGVVGKYFAWRWKNVDTLISAQGATGYLAPGPGPNTTNFLGRLGDATSFNPDYVIVAGGINDPTNGLFDAAQTFYQAVRASLPNAKLVVFGPWWPRTPLDPRILVTDAAISNACHEVGAPFVSTLYPTPWIYGQQPNSGNAAVFIMLDNTHPTESGSEYLGNAMADAVLSLCPDFDVPKPAAPWAGGGLTTNITGLFNGEMRTACFSNGLLIGFQ